MMINYLGGPGRLTLHDDLNYGRKTKLPDAGPRARPPRKTRIRNNLSVERAERRDHHVRGFPSFFLPSFASLALPAPR
jgi:hypothetical protein